MSPRQKFTKEQLIDAAFNIAISEGFDAITIRNVAKHLGSSIAPIYVNYADVEALKDDVVQKSFSVFDTLLATQESSSMFLNYGLASIEFGKKYPLLYDELILKDKHAKFDTSLEEDPVFLALSQENSYRDLSFEEKKILVIKMKALQAGLSLMARKTKYGDYINKENIVTLLMDTEADIIAGIKHRRKGLSE